MSSSSSSFLLPCRPPPPRGRGRARGGSPPDARSERTRRDAGIGAQGEAGDDDGGWRGRPAARRPCSSLPGPAGRSCCCPRHRSAAVRALVLSSRAVRAAHEQGMGAQGAREGGAGARKGGCAGVGRKMAAGERGEGKGRGRRADRESRGLPRGGCRSSAGEWGGMEEQGSRPPRARRHPPMRGLLELPGAEGRAPP
ncbi:hypothetical protein PVAP13_2NG309427 [Panicum virgatum]|uniref:Uncharacterized protein n=1 Tax=Panicum virgatum TaxID=38727 RepID=A0A8T0VDA1_PANVG|nr:hypothetical protein PVAP13_2NG309427 [Panicum virgatum]